MVKRITLAAVLLAAVSIFASVGRDDEKAPTREAAAPQRGGDSVERAVVPELAAGQAPARKPVLDRAEIERAVATAREEHEAALLAFEDAKTRLADIEHEIVAVEGFVEDIKARGEDPTDYAFEGLERLNPVMERLDQLVLDVVAAERRSLETGRALEDAERMLSELDAS